MSENLPLSIERASKIYRQDVSRLEVAREYAKAEMPRFLGADVDPNLVSALDETDEWRRLEALSYTFRLNWTFFDVSNIGNSWSEVELPIAELTMTGMNPAINKIVYSSDVDRDPVIFADYLRDYFDKHDMDEDPEMLGELRPKTTLEEMNVQPLITIERGNGEISMVDGMHRLVASAMLGATSVRVFAGYPNGETSLSMRGDSTMLSLRLAYEAAESHEDKQHVLETTAMIAKNAADGRNAIRRYWIDEATDDDMKDAGRSLLDRIT